MYLNDLKSYFGLNKPDPLKEHIGKLPNEWKLLVNNHLDKMREQGRREGINEAINVLTKLHGEALAKHNYYAHGAVEVKKLLKVKRFYHG